MRKARVTGEWDQESKREEISIFSHENVSCSPSLDLSPLLILFLLSDCQSGSELPDCVCPWGGGINSISKEKRGNGVSWDFYFVQTTGLWSQALIEIGISMVVVLCYPSYMWTVVVGCNEEIMTCIVTEQSILKGIQVLQSAHLSYSYLWFMLPLTFSFVPFL